MDTMHTKALLAGLFFGLWPLFMNKSGLNGNVSAMAFSGTVLLLVSPFALSNMGDLSGIKWMAVAAAGIFGAIGILCFNGMLAKATPSNVGSLIVIMTVVQTCVPAIYQTILNGSITPARAIGFILATLAAILLVKD